MSKYEKLTLTTRGNVAGLAVDLDEVAREGALRMLREVLEAEVEEFLGRKRHERSSTGSERDREAFRGYRNGYGQERRVTVGSGTLPIRAPVCGRPRLERGLPPKCFVATSGVRIGSKS
jgi:transposase-like protein